MVRNVDGHRFFTPRLLNIVYNVIFLPADLYIENKNHTKNE